MSFGDRIRGRLEALPASQAALAREIGVSPQAISKLVTGETTETTKLYQIARFLKTTPEYLMGETDDPSPVSLSDRRQPFHGAEPEYVEPETVMVEEIDLRFGLGGQYIDGPVATEQREFSRAWLRNFTDSPPELLSWTSASGDSMGPTILDSDLILIDRSDRRVEFGDKFWAIAYGQVGMIKRLRPMPDGGVKILSDNPLVPPETAYDEELHVVGRVVAIVRRM